MKVEIEMEGEESEGKYGKFKDYEIECAARTLMEAEEIKMDAEKMKYVQPLLEKKAKVISSLADLKRVAKEKSKSMD